MIAAWMTIMIVLVTLATGWVWLLALWVGVIAGITIGYIWDIRPNARRIL